MGGEDLKNCHQLLISTVRPAPPVTCVDTDDVDAIAINGTPNGIRPSRQEAAVSRAENVTDLAVCVRAAVWLWRFYCQNVRVPRRSIAENGRLREHVIPFGYGEASAIESARYPHTGVGRKVMRCLLRVPSMCARTRIPIWISSGATLGRWLIMRGPSSRSTSTIECGGRGCSPGLALGRSVACE